MLPRPRADVRLRVCVIEEPTCAMCDTRYDGEFFDPATDQMTLYDVGMSALVIAEADALADVLERFAAADDDDIAEQRVAADDDDADAGQRAAAAADDIAERVADRRAASRAADARALRSDAREMRRALNATLWDAPRAIFANRFANGTFSARVSPTSMYALLAGAASDAQALATVEAWLTNATRFGVRGGDDYGGDDHGGDDAFPAPNRANRECYWGLPSIAADDPAFAALGYWRGYVWGPMAQLTHWALERYEHVPAIARARRQLSDQMGALMMDQWTRNRHVCENFDPRANASDCTGTSFYHWGALNGLIALVDAGVA